MTDKFPGDWADVDEDGMWDGPTAEQEAAICDEGDWHEWDNEDIPSPHHYEHMNKMLADSGKICVWFWNGGDPGMGGFDKVFDIQKSG